VVEEVIKLFLRRKERRQTPTVEAPMMAATVPA
jgi:hypothetical protein